MRKYLLIIISLLAFVGTPVFAEVKTYDRKDYDNWGVKKDIQITDYNIDNVYETALVDASEKIYDFADILTDDEELRLREFANEFINKSKMDVVILTINKAYNNDYELENIAADFSRMDYILDYIGDDIGERNYHDAFHDFISELDFYYENGKSDVYKDYYVDSKGILHKRFIPPIIPAFLVSLFVTLIVITTLVRRNKLVSKPTRADEYLDVNSINYTEKNDNFKNAVTTSYVMSSGSGSSGGGSSRHHSSGGGSHSRGSSGMGHSSGGGRHR